MTIIQVKKTLNAADGKMLLDVNLRLPSQQLIGLYGKSGAGKTSLLRILAGLFPPDEAKVVVHGTTWMDTHNGVLLSPQKRKVGLVFQDYALFPNMTVKENLLFALSKGQNPRMVDELIELSELGDLQHQHPLKLSGGQQQRVALARALVQQPQLLLLDEPLSALDQEMREKLQVYLLRVHNTYGLTTILISHNQSEIEKMADQVIVLEAGKVIRQGKSEEVFGRPATPGTLVLKGVVKHCEQVPTGAWVTLEAGDNAWRIWVAGAGSFVTGEKVALEVDVLAAQLLKS